MFFCTVVKSPDSDHAPRRYGPDQASRARAWDARAGRLWSVRVGGGAGVAAPRVDRTMAAWTSSGNAG
jgi:hypothetical protein